MRQLCHTTRTIPFLLVMLGATSAYAASPTPTPAREAPRLSAPASEAREPNQKGEATNEKETIEALRAEKERLELEHALERQRQERSLSQLESKKRAILSQLELDAAKRKQELALIEAETARITAERTAAEQRLALENAKRKLALSKINADLELVEARRSARKQVATDMVYPKQPFQKGVLQVSDRRVSLNGPITMDTADEVTQRLHFFNNQSGEHPIFIVIDYSPGGSVMAGYRILKAMEASQAPIHVVVKSFAASMAAVITTRAEHSYAYPNAIILHHQIAGANMGNLTQQQQRLAEAQEWSRRLLGPVHKKMGLSHDQMVKQMYQHDADGNWKEFADQAAKLKWVDHVVQDVRETGVVELEQKESKAKSAKILDEDAKEQYDPTGRPFVKLPRLLPSDHWFLYNPDGYYR